MKLIQDILIFMVKRYNPFSFGKFIWSLYYAKRDQDNMYGYFREQSSCNDLLLLPSKELRKRYNIDPGSSNAQIFALMEKYFESRKVMKNHD